MIKHIINSIKLFGSLLAYSFILVQPNPVSSEVTLQEKDIAFGWKEYKWELATNTFNELRFTFNTSNATDTISAGSILLDNVTTYTPLSISSTAIENEQERNSADITRKGNIVQYGSSLTTAEGNDTYIRESLLSNATSGGDTFMISQDLGRNKSSAIKITNIYVMKVLLE